MIINDHVVLHHDPIDRCTRLVNRPMTKDAALAYVTELLTTSGRVTYAEDIRAVILPSDGSDIVRSSASLNPQGVHEALKSLTSDEWIVLVEVPHLLHGYEYQQVSDHDLYMAIADIDYEQVQATMQTLHAKKLVELRQENGTNYTITTLLLTRDLSEAELNVFTAIIGFHHAFKKSATLYDIAGNIRDTPEEQIPVLLIQLARKGLITLDEYYTVPHIFPGKRSAARAETPEQLSSSFPGQAEPGKH